jgi:cytoplasmic iron level regulating protein YaaA (DUF328/UPF0246 family)
MLIVISPAKNLDYETPTTTKIYSHPQLLKQAQSLVDICKQLSVSDLSRLMGISKNLADLNAARFADWQIPFTPKNAKQAVLAFNGDVYVGLNASGLPEQDLTYAQDHLRILSGLYGILRPLDLIQPYRLEMGTRLKNPKGENLYQYWGSSIAENLNATLRENKEDTLVNLASDEYFKSVDLNTLDATIVTPVFKDKKNGKYKVISFFAKKARGLMTNFIVKEQIKDVEDLKTFNAGGYHYSEEESHPLKPVFLCDKAV